MNTILKYDQANRVGLVAIARAVTALVVVAMFVVAIATLIASRDHAVAQSGVEPIIRTAPPSASPAESPFGYVEFDWDPETLDGVPGFDSWPRSTWR